MFSFQISPMIDTEFRKTVKILNDLFKEKDRRGRNLDNLYYQRLVTGRQVEVFALQVKLLKELLNSNVLDLNAFEDTYQEQLYTLKLDFVESYRSILSNKSKPYYVEFGETIEITPELRIEKLEFFTSIQLPAEMAQIGNLKVGANTDLNKLLITIQRKLNNCMKWLEDQRNIHAAEYDRIFDSINISDKIILNKSRKLIQVEIEKSFYNSCLFGTTDNIISHINKTYFTTAFINLAIDNLGNSALHLLLVRDEAISINLRAVLLNVDNLPLSRVKVDESTRSTNMVQYLLDNGADISLCNNLHYDALHSALRNNKGILFRMMLAKDKKGNYLYNPNFTQTAEYNRTLLHSGVFFAHLDLLKLIPKYVIDQLINTQTSVENYKLTALHIAAQQNYPSVITWLLEQDANSQITNSLYETALMTAIIANHQEAAKAFHNAGIWLTINQREYLITNKDLKSKREQIIKLLRNIVQAEVHNYNLMLQPKIVSQSSLIEHSIFSSLAGGNSITYLADESKDSALNNNSLGL
jgi:ankyrin repeat protein